MITADQAIKLRDLIAKRCEAEREDEMKGAQPPHDAAMIELELRAAKADLEVFIHTITKDAP